MSPTKGQCDGDNGCLAQGQWRMGPALPGQGWDHPSQLGRERRCLDQAPTTSRSGAGKGTECLEHRLLFTREVIWGERECQAVAPGLVPEGTSDGGQGGNPGRAGRPVGRCVKNR